MSELLLNPKMLKWARETIGVEPEEVARKLNRKKITAETILQWEHGIGGPTYPQFEELAKFYGRPLAIFLFPEPPEEPGLKQDFRTIPDSEIDKIPREIQLLIRKAKVLRFNLQELYDGINPVTNGILKQIEANTITNEVALAERVREILGVSLDEQKSWRTADFALKEWRGCLQEKGVFVFKDAFKLGSYNGFSLYDEEFLIIYINNSTPKNRQIFTLFHELAHLLFNTGGIDYANNSPIISKLSGEDYKIEVLCNSFAGAFLVPDDDFDKEIRNEDINDEFFYRIASLYNVSREVILRKCLKRGLIDNQYYRLKVKEWSKDCESRSSKSSGGEHYNTKGAYLGKKYIELVFSQYYRKRISVEEVADYLNTKVKYVPEFEHRFLTSRYK